MTELPPFPEAVDADSDDVSWALETGRSMWAQGDHHEALKWLKRAAESASEDEDDMRSLELAKAAAELRNVVGDSYSQAPPPASSAAGPSSQAPPPASSAPSPLSQPPRGPLPPPPPPPPPRNASTAPAAKPASAAPPAATPPPSPTRSGSGAPPPTSSRSASAAPSKSAAPAAASAPPEAAPSSGRSGAAEDEDRATLVDQREKTSVPPKAKAVDKRDAIRVAVQQVEGKPNVCVVLPLRIGDRPGPGMREALLIPLDDKGPLFSE